MYAYNLGMLDFQERMEVEKELLKLTFAINNENWDRAHDLFDDTFDKVTKAAGGVNAYNWRSFVDDLPLKPVDDFLTNPDNARRYNIKSSFSS